MTAPMEAVSGVEMHLPAGKKIASARVLESSAVLRLSWDRFVRLKASAECLKKVVRAPAKLLDAGGYDGALALFMLDYQVDVIDPATTGGSILDIPAREMSYDAVLAVDVLEHIHPDNRFQALTEFSRVAKKCVVINYPSAESKEAQELVLKLTGNSLIEDHVQWPLPNTKSVLNQLASLGFNGTLQTHSSIAIWIGQYVALNLAPQSAKELNRHLIENYSDEPCSKALYHLITALRSEDRPPGNNPLRRQSTV